MIKAFRPASKARSGRRWSALSGRLWGKATAGPGPRFPPTAAHGPDAHSKWARAVGFGMTAPDNGWSPVARGERIWGRE